EKPRSRVSLFITRRDAALLMKLLDPPFPYSRPSPLNAEHLQNSIAFSADAAFVRTKPFSAGSNAFWRRDSIVRGSGVSRAAAESASIATSRTAGFLSPFN